MRIRGELGQIQLCFSKTNLDSGPSLPSSKFEIGEVVGEARTNHGTLATIKNKEVYGGEVWYTIEFEENGRLKTTKLPEFRLTKI